MPQSPAGAWPLPTLTEGVRTNQIETIEETPQIENREKSPLTRVLESNAEAVEAQKSLLQWKLEAGEDEQGLKILGKLSSVQPENAVEVFIGQAVECNGQYKEARGFEDIQSVNWLSFEALFENVLLMDGYGEREAVIKRLEEALKIAEEEEKVKEARDVRLIMALVQFLRKNVEEALRSYEQLEKEDPKDFRPYLCKGTEYHEPSPENFEVEGYWRTPLLRIKLFATDEDENQGYGL